MPTGATGASGGNKMFRFVSNRTIVYVRDTFMLQDCHDATGSVFNMQRTHGIFRLNGFFG
jgi:hypothetical protein